MADRVLRAHRVELELTARQRRWCERACAASRITYNWGLAEWKRWYRWQRLDDSGKQLVVRLRNYWRKPVPDYDRGASAFGVHARLTAEKRRSESRLSWLTELENSYVPREAIAALGAAYTAFFRRLKKHRAGDHSECGKGRRGRCALGAPRFHKRRHDEGFHVDQGSSLKSRTVYGKGKHRHPRGELYVPGLGLVRTKRGQKLPEARFDPNELASCSCGTTELKHKTGCPAKLTKRDREKGKEPGDCTCCTTKLEHDKSCPARRAKGVWIGDVEICGVGIRRWGGRWYASLRVRETVKERPRKPKVRMAVEVGVRYRAVTYHEDTNGTPHVGAFSDTRTDPLIDKLERRCKLWERRMARRFKRGVAIRDQSRGWFEARAKVGELHRKIAQVRADRIHHVSRAIVDSGAAEIVVRDMDVKSLLARGVAHTDAERQVRNVLADDVQKAGMGELRRQLAYKQAWAGGTTTTVPRDVVETRRCAECGCERPTAPGYPWFVCPACGHADDRDTNAARVRYDYRPLSGEPVAGPGTPGSNGGGNSANGRDNRITGSRRISGGATPDRSGKRAASNPARRESCSGGTTSSPRDASGTDYSPYVSEHLNGAQEPSSDSA